MSYDLYFTSPRISHEAFCEFFAGNKRYQVASGEAVYQNPDTGVYFIFNCNESTDTTEGIPHCASFNLNYFRPHYFGLEAVSEVTRCVERFGFSINDPQNEGMGDGPYSPEGFLKGWNQGNAFGYSAILGSENGPAVVHCLPTQQLDAIWRWNHQKAQYQASIKEDLFVPRIFFLLVQNRVVSAAVWPDAISELVPEVDYLLIGRESLAPRRLLGGRRKDECVIPFSEALPVLAPYRVTDYAMTAYRLPSPNSPAEAQEFVRSLRPSGIGVTGIAPDQVLNREMVDRCRRTQSLPG